MFMNFFSDELIAQLVVLSFLLLVTLRPLLKKTQYTESLSVLSIIALFLAFLLIIVFGLSLLLIILFSLSFIVLITNIASMYRLANALYTVRNTALFRVVSFAEAFLVVLCVIGCFYFKPLPYDTSLQNKYLYSGSFSRGFTEKEEIFTKTSLVVSEYKHSEANLSFEDQKENESNIALVYLPSIGNTSDDAALFLSACAEMGVSVFTGDFFALDAINTETASSRNRNNNPILKPYALHFMSDIDGRQSEKFLAQKELELEALLTLAGQKYEKVIIFTEGLTASLATDAQKKYPNFIRDVIVSVKDNTAAKYYNAGIADYALLDPFDAYASRFKTWKEYTAFRHIGLTEKPHLRLAREIVSRIEEGETE